MLIILSIKNGECIFFNEVGLNRDARKKPTNETTKRLLMLLCFFFPRMLFLCLKTD